MGWWLRNIAAGAVVGFVVGAVVGGTLGRVVMRIVFPADHDALGFQTAMGAIIGEFTAGGTEVIYGFGALAGLALGVAYSVARTLLPRGTRRRTAVFTLGTSAFMLGFIVRLNREDFALLAATLSLLLVVASVALTAAPVPILVERVSPDRTRQPGHVARAVVALGMTGFAVFALTGVMIAHAP